MGRCRSRVAATLAALALASCTSFEEVDVENYLTGLTLEMSTAPAPPEAAPLNVVAIYKSGFYLLGYLPIVGVRLGDCMRRMAEHAKQLGADGIADLRVVYEPASLLKFAAFPIPDWSASISVTGMAYRLPHNPAYPPRPGR
ncbi:MAG: hypothetical protein AAF628_24490 [Planctomycetota bacterium]